VVCNGSTTTASFPHQENLQLSSVSVGMVVAYNWDFFEVNNSSHGLAHMTRMILRFTGLLFAMPSGTASQDATASHKLSVDAPLHEQKCNFMVSHGILKSIMKFTAHSENMYGCHASYSNVEEIRQFLDVI